VERAAAAVAPLLISYRAKNCPVAGQSQQAPVWSVRRSVRRGSGRAPRSRLGVMFRLTVLYSMDLTPPAVLA